ncbi:MAG: polysaccharide deacetylase family protein [Pseudomonadota bacterium]
MALAACGPEKLGTARTIQLDATKHTAFEGHESALGLRHKEVILTFDDGPISGRTSSVLKTLQTECVKATFFVVGRMARFQQKLVKRIVAQGHTLAHHTNTHDRLPAYKLATAGKRIDAGIAAVQRAAYGKASTTPRVPFFRYPYLARTAATDTLLRERGLIAFGANIDSLDWKKDSPSTVHDRIMKRLRKAGRGIILMHDIQPRTVAMLPRLLKSLKAEGYKVVHIVPKGAADPKPLDPVVVASVAPAPVSKPVDVVSVTSALLNGTPARKKIAKVGKSDSRAGIVVLKAPEAPAIRQLRPRAKAKPTRVAALSRKAKARSLVTNKRWKLRRSQWIIN